MKAITLIAAIAVTTFALSDHAMADSHTSDHDDTAMQGIQPIEIGDLRIEGAFARATRPGQPVGGGYMTIMNTGDRDDRLLSMSSPVAGRGEIHEMEMDGDVMRMRALPDGLIIPAGESVELKPGGLHLMFVDLEGPLITGEIAPVTLTFEIAGQVDLPLPVADNAAQRYDGSTMGQDN